MLLGNTNNYHSFVLNLNPKLLIMSINKNESQKSNNELLLEAATMQELLGPWLEINTANDEFFNTIESAFTSLAKQSPDDAETTLRTFSKLTSMFRLAALHNDFMSKKIQEYATLEAALNDEATVRLRNIAA